MQHFLNDISLNDLFKTGVQRGYLLNFKSMKNIFSVKLGSTIYMYGSPYAGKTQFKYEILMQLSMLYGLRHAIYDPETGRPEHVKVMLTEIYTGKDFYDTYGRKMEEADVYKAANFLDEHFYLFTGEDLSPIDFYSEVELFSKEHNKDIHTTSIDPWDDMIHDMTDFNGRDDKYLAHILKAVREDAIRTNRCHIIVTHVRDQQIVTEGGLRYYPPATPRELAGGQVWYRKGMTMMSIWKPPIGKSDSEGGNFEWDDIQIIMQKQKPQGVALRGEQNNIATLKFDPKKHRYYEPDGQTF